MKIDLKELDTVTVNLARKRPNGEEAIVFLLWFKNKSTWNESLRYTGNKAEMHRNNVGRGYAGLVKKEILVVKGKVGDGTNAIVIYGLHPSMTVKPVIKPIKAVVESDCIKAKGGIQSDCTTAVESDCKLSSTQAQSKDTSVLDSGTNASQYSNTVNYSKRTVRPVSEIKFGVEDEFFKLLYQHLMSTKTWITTSIEVTNNYFLINDTTLSLEDFSTKLHSAVSMRFKPNDPDPEFVTYGTYYHRVFDAVYDIYRNTFKKNAIIKIEKESFREIPLLKAELRKVLYTTGYSDTEVEHILTHPNIIPEDEDKSHEYRKAMLKYFRDKLGEYDTQTLINMEMK